MKKFQDSLENISYDPRKSHYVAITGIVIKNGKYLIAKRAPHEKVFPNLWHIPGGKLEANDYMGQPKTTPNQWYNVFETALRREIKEEVGLKIKNIRYLTNLVFIRPDNIPVIVISLFADYAGGRVKLCKDLVEYNWVSLKEAKKYELIEGIYDEIKMLDKILINS